jgi:hypothetical protein
MLALICATVISLTLLFCWLSISARKRGTRETAGEVTVLLVCSAEESIFALALKVSTRRVFGVLVWLLLCLLCGSLELPARSWLVWPHGEERPLTGGDGASPGSQADAEDAGQQ